MENKSIKINMNKIGGFKDITIGIIMVSLFSLSMITFGFQMAINNNAQENILNDPSLSGLNETLTERLSELRQTSQTQRESFEGQEAQGGTSDEGFSLTSIVGIVKTFFGTAIGSFNLIFVVLSNILGIPPIVLNLLLGSIIMIIILLIWRIIKAGGI